MTDGATKPVETLLLEAGPGSAARSRFHRDFDGAVSPADHLGHAFLATAISRADIAALTTQAGSCSYAELSSCALDVSRTLQQSPTFIRGSRVLLLLPNSLEFVAAYYGVLLAGGIVVPLPPKIERQQFHSIQQSTDALHVITKPRIARSRADILSPELASKIAAGEPIGLEKADEDSANQLAVILFTGGSSGAPKGVMLSHHNLLANARSIQQYLRIQANDRPLCVLPFYHAFGNSVLQSHILAGSQLVLDGNATFPETLIEAIVKHQVTSLSGVPELFRFLLERSSLGSTPLPSLKYMAVAGGALPFELTHQIAAKILPANFVVMYGQTEATARLAFVPPERLNDLGSGCIGRAVPGVELEVVDESNHRVAAGEIGEIRARGPNIMRGYWQNPDLTAEVVRDGWLYTGDLGESDSDGWIYHRGRRNALIKIAGYRIHPSDVEDFVIRSLPIHQAVLVPYEQAGSGTRLALFVRRSAEATDLNPLQIIARCRADLPRHMVPDLVQLVDEFPLNDAMKIDRPRLMNLAAEAALHRRKTA